MISHVIKLSLIHWAWHWYWWINCALIFHIFSESQKRQTDGNIKNKLSQHFTCKGSTKGIADFMADKIMVMSYRMGLCGCRLTPVWGQRVTSNQDQRMSGVQIPGDSYNSFLVMEFFDFVLIRQFYSPDDLLLSNPHFVSVISNQ